MHLSVWRASWCICQSEGPASASLGASWCICQYEEPAGASVSMRGPAGASVSLRGQLVHLLVIGASW